MVIEKAVILVLAAPFEPVAITRAARQLLGKISVGVGAPIGFVALTPWREVRTMVSGGVMIVLDLEMVSIADTRYLKHK